MSNKTVDDLSNTLTPIFSILVVDDDPQVVATIRDILVSEGFDVETAENGKEAIDLVMGSHQFDLVITDMKMPDMDGLEVLRQVQQYKKYLPVIVMTGYATVENGMRCVEAGAYNYIVKPFDTKSLIRLVTDSIETSFTN